MTSNGGGSSLLADKVTQASITLAIVAVVAGTAYLFYVQKKRAVLNKPDRWQKFKLTKRTQVSHNVVKLHFSLPTPKSILGLPIGQHVSCRGTDPAGEEVTRPYTPTTLDSDVGHFDLVVKVYAEGRMSQYLHRMKEGEFLHIKGPKGRFRYTPGQVKAFGMLAGGTGITPMFQVARAILENPKDNTKIHLIYANVTVHDILLKDELESFVKLYPDRFKIYYVLNEPPEDWQGGVGFVSQDMIREHLPPPAEDIKILRCGPPGMNKAMAAHQDAIGYTKEMQFQF